MGDRLETALLVADPEAADPYRASVDLRVQLARVMDHHPEPWGPDELGILHRLLRDPEGPVWEEACRTVGERATAEPGALEELQTLLGSPSAEIRLRGVWAMRGLARERQIEVAEFLVQRLGEPSTLEDAALLAALLRVAAALPRDLGEGVLVFCLDDPRADIRAAAAASLPDWEPWPRLLLYCADDPSPVVRAALAVSLRYLPTSDEVDAVLEALAEDSDPMVRFAVTEALSVDDFPDPYDDGGAEPNAVARAREVEEALGMDPGTWRTVLENCLEWPDGREILALAAELGREPGVRALARALGWLAEEVEDSLAGASGALQEGGQGCESLAAYLTVCARAAAAQSEEDLAEWCRMARPCVESPLSTQAGLGLEDLLDLAGQMASGLDPWSARVVHARLLDLEGAIREWPLPERVATREVIRAWVELLQGPPEEEAP